MVKNINTAIGWLMRAGYAARGLVYFVVGLLALFAAINGGEAEGTTGALAYIFERPLGAVLLGFIAAGLLAYTLWRLVDGIMDLETEGDDAEGYANRAGQIMSGLTHAVLAASAVTILWKGHASDDGNSAANCSAMLMQHPTGRAVVIAAGLTTLGVSIYLFAKSWQASYRRDIRCTPVTERLAPLLRYGLASHGFVLLIVGGLILYAGLTANAEHAVGLGEALEKLETQPFGRLLLSLTGIGLMGFALYCFVQARYRIVPRLSPSDVPTLG
tara:strand:+ start:29653 stop:30468 length:816 start_codon:yes stop_codon:yes gene_type:complete